MKPSGVMMSGNQARHGLAEPSVNLLNQSCAISAASAKATLIRPIAIAPHQKTSRGFHKRGDIHIARERRMSGTR